MAPKDFTVVVVGGGMCGLACVTALLRAGIEAHVYESAEKFDEVGAGVGLGPNAIRSLQGLGILQDILSKADPPRLAMRPYTFLSGAGEHKPIFDYALSSDELGLSIYRPMFLDALIPTIDPKYTHFNKRCTFVSTAPSGRHVVHFSDGTSVETDLVIGADGIKSVVRTFVAGEDEHKHLVYHNTATYRGLVSIAALKKDGVKSDLTRPSLWLGLNKHCVTYPIRANDLLNVGAVINTSRIPSPPVTGAWVETVSPEEVSEAFQDWGEDIRIILKHIKQHSKWSMHAINPPLEHYIKDKVVLIGDAAHAMVPHLSAGVGQGFEDVYALYRLLTHPETNLGNLKAVLATYDKIRPPRANMVLKRSLRMGEIYESYGPGQYDDNDIKEQLQGMWEPVWYHDVGKEVSRELTNLFGSHL